jgi:capsular exopolysaccharide synthesis family protein
MSKFFKALDQADRERALREQAGRQQEDLTEVMPDAAAAPPTPAGQPLAPRSTNWPAAERFHSPEPGRSPGPAVEATDGVEEHLVSLLTPTSFEAEQYRALRHMVEQMHKDADLHALAVTSPAVGDGKTTTAINLAGALAQAPQARVLLLEADLRRPSVIELLDLGDCSGRSLVDAILAPDLSLQAVVRPRHPFNLAVLPAGHPQAASYEVLKSPRLGELLAEARQHYDYIIVDTPPLVPLPDCRLIARWIDGFLVVVAAHKTPRKLVEEALKVVDPPKMLGLVFNSDERPVFGYHRHYHHAGDQSPNGDRMGWLSRAVRRIGSSV